MPILREYAEEFLATRRFRGRPLAPRTTDLYRWVLDRRVLANFGDRELSTLTPPESRRSHARLSGPDWPGSNTAPELWPLEQADLRNGASATSCPTRRSVR